MFSIQTVLLSVLLLFFVTNCECNEMESRGKKKKIALFGKDFEFYVVLLDSVRMAPQSANKLIFEMSRISV